jgi:hypothetical protein
MAIETSIVWDDMLGQAIAANLDTSSGRIDYNYDELGITFQDNARYPQEPLGIPFQFSHRAAVDNELRPHIHWIQEQADIPNFLIEYRVYKNGETPPAFTQAIGTGEVFTYTSGTILQVTNFPAISVSDFSSSECLDIRLYRDSINTSGLFAGNDPVANDVTVKFIDVHFKVDTMGSRQEFIK